MKLNTFFSGILLGIPVFAILIFSCKSEEDPISTVPFENVSSLDVGSNSEVYLATNKGVFRLNATNKKYISIEGDYFSGMVNDLGFDSNPSQSSLWIATHEGLMNLFQHTVYSADNGSLPSNQIENLYVDITNRICISFPGGISIFSSNKWIQYNGFDDLFSRYPISDIAASVNGDFYITTQGGGVERFTVEVDGISGATVFDTDWSGLRSNNVFTVFVDSTVQAYGTDAGVAIHSSEYTKWDWETYSSDNGLICDTVVSITRDLSKHWWFGTPMGISEFDGNVWKNYTKESSGILDNSIRFASASPDGAVWFLTDQGLMQFNEGTWTHYLFD